MTSLDFICERSSQSPNLDERTSWHRCSTDRTTQWLSNPYKILYCYFFELTCELSTSKTVLQIVERCKNMMNMISSCRARVCHIVIPPPTTNTLQLKPTNQSRRRADSWSVASIVYRQTNKQKQNRVESAPSGPPLMFIRWRRGSWAGAWARRVRALRKYYYYLETPTRIFHYFKSETRHRTWSTLRSRSRSLVCIWKYMSTIDD